MEEENAQSHAKPDREHPLLSRRANGAPPIWLMRQAGRYLPEYRELRAKASSFLEFCYTPSMAVEATLQPIQRYGFDAAILFSDILVIPDALGVDVKFVEGTGPVLSPVQTQSEVEGLRPAVGVPDRLGPVYDALKTLRSNLDAQTALIGFAGAPWTIATYVVEGRGGHDFAAIKKMMWQAPNLFAALMSLLEEAVAVHLIEQVNAGADTVKVFDSWAGVLPEPEFRRWCIAPMQRIVDRFRQVHPSVPVIGFPRQAGALYADYQRETGVDVVAVDPSVPIGLLQEMQKFGAVQGNLDPQLLVAGDEAMVARVREILDGLRTGPHVFNLGHGVVPPTPPEHVDLLVETVRASAQLAA